MSSNIYSIYQATNLINVQKTMKAVSDYNIQKNKEEIAQLDKKP